MDSTVKEWRQAANSVPSLEQFHPDRRCLLQHGEQTPDCIPVSRNALEVLFAAIEKLEARCSG